MIQNIVYLFRGLTYFDRTGLGTAGLHLSTSLYFISNAVLACFWFLFLVRMLYRKSPPRWVCMLAAVPRLTVIALVAANTWTGRLLTAGEKVERKRYAIITFFALVSVAMDALQVFLVTVPCTSAAFQIALMLVYVFVSVERSENVLLSVCERQQNTMKTALAQTAAAWYEFNLDQDILYDGSFGLPAGGSIRPAVPGQRYTAFFESLPGGVVPADADRYRKTFSPVPLRNISAGETRRCPCAAGSGTTAVNASCSRTSS